MGHQRDSISQPTNQPTNIASKLAGNSWHAPSDSVMQPTNQPTNKSPTQQVDSQYKPRPIRQRASANQPANKLPTQQVDSQYKPRPIKQAASAKPNHPNTRQADTSQYMALNPIRQGDRVSQLTYQPTNQTTKQPTTQPSQQATADRKYVPRPTRWRRRSC